MAAINELITLGIGTPAGIPYFLLVGLSNARVQPRIQDVVASYATRPQYAAARATTPDCSASGEPVSFAAARANTPSSSTTSTTSPSIQASR